MIFLKSMVLIHKTPAQWSKKDWLKDQFGDSESVIPKKNLSSNSLVRTLLDDDVYIQLCLKLCDLLGIDKLHIVQGFSGSEQRNWVSEEEVGEYHISDKMTYWCISHPQDLVRFLEGDLLFTRGNYQHLHSLLSEQNQSQSRPIWIHYPATASVFPHLKSYREKTTKVLENKINDVKTLSERITGMSVEHQIKNLELIPSTNVLDNLGLLLSRFLERQDTKNTGPYDIVLADDEDSVNQYEKVYEKSIIVKFTKPCTIFDHDVSYQREYDLFFCGTTLQSTKNHMQFVALLNRIDREIDSPMKVGIAGNRGDLVAFSDGIGKKYRNLRIDDYGEVSRSRLFELFNDSRTLIVLSGRDCNPRIIQEAGVCGARVIVADTMSNGLEILYSNPILGAVIPTKKESWFYQRNGNLIFDVNRKFTQKVLYEIKRSNSPFATNKLASSIYSIDTASKSLAITIKMLI